MREEKRKLKAEGKLYLDPNDEDNSFKYLTEREKFKRAKELFEQGLRLNEISEVCKVSERTVRRWKGTRHLNT
jgi:DNA-binding NarL/FixJ family response regulator